jgi:hypothetical protein
MPSIVLLDTCGRRRPPATLSGFHPGRPPRNKRLRYPADPPTVEQIIVVMRAGADADAVRLRGRPGHDWLHPGADQNDVPRHEPADLPAGHLARTKTVSASADRVPDRQPCGPGSR